MLWEARHKCVVGSCSAFVDPTHLMCFSHWAWVNPALQTLYWRMRHNGKPRDGFDDVCQNIIMQVEEILDVVRQGSIG